MKGLILWNHNNEDLEAIATKALLTRAGYDIISATLESTRNLELAYQTRVKADAFLGDVDPDDFDFLIIPGGKYVAETVDQDLRIKHLAKTFNECGKLVAAICAGPRFLGQAGLLDGKRFTCFKGAEKDMPKGTYLPDEKAVTDGNIITSRSAGTIFQFVTEIITYLEGKEKSDALLKSILY